MRMRRHYVNFCARAHVHDFSHFDYFAEDGFWGLFDVRMSRIYVGRLSYQVREKDVERFFRGFGRIRDINLKNGFGFVVSRIQST